MGDVRRKLERLDGRAGRSLATGPLIFVGLAIMAVITILNWKFGGGGIASLISGLCFVGFGAIAFAQDRRKRHS